MLSLRLVCRAGLLFLALLQTGDAYRITMEAKEGKQGNTPKLPSPSTPLPPARPRVDAKLGVPLRKQLQWAKANKAYIKAQEQGGAPSRSVHRKFKKVKSDAEQEFVKQPDMSKVEINDDKPTLVVDGYNIIMAYSRYKKWMKKGGSGLSRARDMLLEDLTELKVMRSWDVHVVFDNSTGEETMARTSTTAGGIKVTFTTKEQTADRHIEREAQVLSNGGCPRIMVASGDNAIRNVVAGHGAEILSPTKMIQVIKVARKEALANAVKGPGEEEATEALDANRLYGSLDDWTTFYLQCARVGMTKEEARVEWDAMGSA